jgi:hypothetical protein
VAPPKPIALAAAALDKCVGVYKLDEKRRLVVRRDGDHLTAQPSGGPAFALAAEADGTFYVEEPPIRAIFTRDQSGKITGADVTMPTPRHLVRTDEPLPAERQAVALDEKQLERYVGSYELRPNFILAVTREGARLFTQATGQPRFEIFASALDEFFVKAFDSQLSFHVDKSGLADGVVIHQGGRDLAGKRVARP